MSRVALVGLLVIALAGVSCSKSPEQYFESGNQYFKNKQYKEAIVQYSNAIQKNGRYGEARLKLAEAYVAVNNGPKAFGEYVRAAELLPQNVDVQLKAATFLLMAGRFEDAKARAERKR